MKTIALITIMIFLGGITFNQFPSKDELIPTVLNGPYIKTNIPTKK